jgi:hypothetical protein
MQEWNEVLLADDTIWDQNAFNDLFRRKMVVDDTAGSKRLFWCALFTPDLIMSLGE